MEIILSQNVEKLGKVGDVVKVKDGFARNYLLPNKIGVAATAGNIKKIAQFKAKEAARSWLESVRWPNGPICPHCGADATRVVGGDAVMLRHVVLCQQEAEEIST